MDTKVIIVGASLVVVGAFAALGGTFSMQHPQLHSEADLNKR